MLCLNQTLSILYRDHLCMYIVDNWSRSTYKHINASQNICTSRSTLNEPVMTLKLFNIIIP